MGSGRYLCCVLYFFMLSCYHYYHYCYHNHYCCYYCYCSVLFDSLVASFHSSIQQPLNPSTGHNKTPIALYYPCIQPHSHTPMRCRSPPPYCLGTRVARPGQWGPWPSRRSLCAPGSTEPTGNRPGSQETTCAGVGYRRRLVCYLGQCSLWEGRCNLWLHSNYEYWVV